VIEARVVRNAGYIADALACEASGIALSRRLEAGGQLVRVGSDCARCTPLLGPERAQIHGHDGRCSGHDPTVSWRVTVVDRRTDREIANHAIPSSVSRDVIGPFFNAPSENDLWGEWLVGPEHLDAIESWTGGLFDLVTTEVFVGESGDE